MTLGEKNKATQNYKELKQKELAEIRFVSLTSLK